MFAQDFIDINPGALGKLNRPKEPNVLKVGDYIREDRYREYMSRADGGLNYRYQESCGEPEVISMIHQFVDKLPTQKGTPFLIKEIDGKTVVLEGPQKAFKDLLVLCGSTLITAGLHYSPQVEAFAEIIGRFRVHELLGNSSSVYAYDRSERLAAEVYNEAYEALKAEVDSRGYRRKISASVRRCREACNSGMGYIDALFKKHSRLLVGRIDLAFNRQLKRHLDVQRVDALFKSFMRRIRSTALGRMLVGYIWCLECTRDHGFHYHMLVFFDGSKHQNHKHLVQQIGEQWVRSVERDLQAAPGHESDPRTDLDPQVTPPGKAIFHNCNLSVYQQPFLGQINHDDVLLRERLYENVAYICKADQLLGVKVSRGMRTMGRGELPRIRAVKRGRPREYTVVPTPRAKSVAAVNRQLALLS